MRLYQITAGGVLLEQALSLAASYCKARDAAADRLGQLVVVLLDGQPELTYETGPKGRKVWVR